MLLWFRDCAGKRVRALHRPVGQEEREEGGEEHHRHLIQQVSQPKQKASYRYIEITTVIVIQ